jgi:hypothetical protein
VKVVLDFFFNEAKCKWCASHVINENSKIHEVEVDVFRLKSNELSMFSTMFQFIFLLDRNIIKLIKMGESSCYS